MHHSCCPGRSRLALMPGLVAQPLGDWACTHPASAQHVHPLRTRTRCFETWPLSACSLSRKTPLDWLIFFASPGPQGRRRRAAMCLAPVEHSPFLSSLPSPAHSSSSDFIVLPILPCSLLSPHFPLLPLLYSVPFSSCPIFCLPYPPDAPCHPPALSLHLRSTAPTNDSPDLCPFASGREVGW